MLSFNRRFFFLAIILFIAEVLIALYVNDDIIRPYGGDFLVVILLYCTARAFTKIAPLKIAIGVFLFACGIETLQYFHIVDRLGLTHNQVARTVIGYGFEWLDILTYFLGTVTVLVLEKLKFKKIR